MIVKLFAPLDHDNPKLLLILVFYRVMHQAILRVYGLWLSWIFNRVRICAVNAMHHGRHFLLFMLVYVYHINDDRPENLLFVLNFLTWITGILFERLGIEVFCVRDWSGQILILAACLALFAHLAALALLLIVHLFLFSNLLQHYQSPLVVHCIFLAQLPIRRTKFESSVRIAARKSGITSIQTHAWALYSGMHGSTSLLLYPLILHLTVTRS